MNSAILANAIMKFDSGEKPYTVPYELTIYALRGCQKPILPTLQFFNYYC